MDIKAELSAKLSVRADHAANIIQLIEDGNTIPFIARYRKEMTGAIDDQKLREFSDQYTYLCNLEKRKGEVRDAIEGQGKMTPELLDAIDKARTLTEIEDIYRPYKQKRRTRASIAAEKGLKPLADLILAQDPATDPFAEAEKFINPDLGVNSADEALAGAKDIIAETASDSAEVRKNLRAAVFARGTIGTKLNPDKEKSDVYEMYADFSQAVSRIAPHRVLAINRGEKEECLKVSLIMDTEAGEGIVKTALVAGQSACSRLVEEACTDAYSRLIFPSVEREVRSELTDTAVEQAIKMFDKNLRPLLLQPPVRGKVVVGLDPAYRTGCKIALVDATGKPLDMTVIYPTPPQNRTEDAARELTRLIIKHGAEVVAIGNGTASREAEQFVAGLIKEFAKSGRKLAYVIVNEAGASVYSASKLAAAEFPDLDVAYRSAISIARRLLDPLAELIKIDPKSIGVGQYQHDCPAARLDAVLGGVVEDCVNSVGVDLNTASSALLAHVAGLNQATAKNIVERRDTEGRYTHRAELLKVAKLGAKAFTQCAGFLRIPDSENILDNTAVHPESYGAAEELLKFFGYTLADAGTKKLAELPKKTADYGKAELANKLGIGEHTLNDIIAELMRPGRDIREELPPPILHTSVLEISDLKEGMELLGTVRNVIDFGAFVDIGVHQDGLIHISELCNRYIKHPSEVVEVGDIVSVRVIGIDLKKNRISLSMKAVD